MEASELLFVIGIVIAGILVGLLLFGFATQKKKLASAFQEAQKEASKIMQDARQESDRIVKNALRESKEDQTQRRRSFEQEANQRQSEIRKLEETIKKRESSLEKKLEIIEKRENELESLEAKLEADEQNYRTLIKDAETAITDSRRLLERVAGMSAEEARRELVRTLETKARNEVREKIRRIESEMKREAEMKAQSVVSLAVQRIASEYVNDSTVSVITLPSDDMKGRIIGREGRNIRAIEQMTGVDLIIDDTPEAVIISCFNPIRREIAKLAIEKLIADGRIHPARIEETVQRVEEEFNVHIREIGDQAAFDIGLTDLPPELLFNLGKLKFRTAGTQSVLAHSLEVARICAIMANELGMNTKKAKRAGFLHDIGKAVDQEIEGHHAEIGANLCEKLGEDPLVVAAIRNHHKEDQTNLDSLSTILHSANVLSEQRPAARKEQLETYIKRLGDMEELVKGFENIDRAYVMQAGRELRAIVTSRGVSDEEVTDIANDIASALRKELSFPGQVRVSVMRESKFVDYAK
ncbi:MAG: ribonuclease Y [Oligoflexales bacterium]|nr:ribonuclease Y [Oligoflexales bacterium]